MGRPSLGRAPPHEYSFHSSMAGQWSDVMAKAKPARLGFFASAKSLVQIVWNRGAGVQTIECSCFKASSAQTGRFTEARKSAMALGSSGAPPLGSQTKRTSSGSSNSSVQTNAPGCSTLAVPVTIRSLPRLRLLALGNLPRSIHLIRRPLYMNARSSTVADYGQSHNRGISLVGFSSLGRKTGLAANNDHASSMTAKSNIGT